MTKTYRRPAALAFTGLIGGILASLAGNVQAITLDNAEPGVGAIISAVIWPAALFVAIEIMLHTPWVSSRRDNLVRWVGLLGVAFIALYVSYWHLVHVLDNYGYDAVASHAAPLAVDGLLAMSTLALNRVGQARRGDQDMPTAKPVLVTHDEMHDALATADYGNALTEQDKAIVQAADELATETESYLERLGRELDNTTTPPVPVIAVQVPSRVRRPGIEPELTDLLTSWDYAGRPLSKGEVDELLAAHHGVSTRTIRRRREALGLI